MTGRREMKKKITKKNILESALKLFLDKGFDCTTMVEIGGLADTGASTVYNYFDSKSDLLFHCLIKMVDETFEKTISSNSPKSDSVVDQLMFSIDSYLKAFKDTRKDLFKEIFDPSEKGQLEKIISTVYSKHQKHSELLTIKNTLSKLRDENKLNASFDLDSGVITIVNTCVFQVIIYLFDESMEYGEMISNIKKSISFVFENKIA